MSGDKEHTYRRFGQGAMPIAETMKLLKQIKFGCAANRGDQWLNKKSLMQS